MKWKSIIMFISGAVFAAGLMVILILFSPLRYDMVDSSKVEIRRDLVQARFQNDSLISVNARLNSYLQNCRMQFHTADTKVTSADSTKSFHVASELSSEVSLINSPVKGVVKEAFNPSSRHLGTTVLCAKDATVLSLMKGIVISVGYSEEHKWEVIVQHNDGFLSVYRFLPVVLCQSGDFLEEGDVIGTMSSQDGSKFQPAIEIQLWRNGVPLDVQEYVSF